MKNSIRMTTIIRCSSCRQKLP